MSNQTINKSYVTEMLQTNGFGVLATEGDGQPHASLVAVTPIDNFTHLVFATYRNTSKYKNLLKNPKVAILFENRSVLSTIQPDIFVLTAFGYAEEVDSEVSDSVHHAHLLRHPNLVSFLSTSDCAIFRVNVNAYQMVSGIDDVKWWYINV
jgi:nitroimidazol reductase NimA-like FMN-containing flavoprotein (pyridoxamine 5'-phosphate oxidase superfamily)